jgi:HSP20 family protein
LGNRIVQLAITQFFNSPATRPTRPSATIEIVAFARWDPLRDLLSIQHRLERMSSGPQGWIPAVDLCETADAFIVTAELPGLTRDQVRIEVHDGRLLLHGRRDARVPCEQYHQVERGHGEFSRAFALPPSVDPQQISADLHQGVLTIVIPKTPDRGPRRVDVS